MKTLLIHMSIVICGSYISTSAYSQSDFLNINNIKAGVDANALFHDPTNFSASYESPSGGGSHTIYAASLWLAGKDVGGTIKTNVNTYYNSNQPIAGPIMGSSFYATDGASWDRVWKITCQEIQEFVSWYEAGVCDAMNGTTTQSTNFPGYIIPSVILDWPAHGDISKGQAFNLAPYFDNNGDNLYDPNAGDYPIVKGDEAIFFIYNDERPVIDGTHSHAPMKTEVHGMVYGYSNNDVALSNTVFLNYKIYNRSTTNYDSCYVGFWADLDLGNSTDDRVGSDVERSSFYAYNGDSFDEDIFGVIGYGSNLPSQGITFLKGAKMNNDGTDNPFTQIMQDVIDSNGTPYECLGSGFGDGVIDNEFWGLEHFLSYSSGSGQFPGDGTPVTESDFYNYLKGNWRDGSPFVYGGNGHLSGGGVVPAKYLFSGNTDPLYYNTGGVVATPTNWQDGISGDRKGIGSSGPFTLAPGSSLEIDLALVFGRDQTGSGPLAGVAVMQERIDSICSYFKNGIIGNCNANGLTTGCVTGLNQNIPDHNSIEVSPNPFNNELTINYELINNSATLIVYNLIGEQIKVQSLTQKRTILELTYLPSGIYFIMISDGENRVTKKIVKQ